MKRILLMDDSELSLELTGAALRAAGYEVVCAKDLEQLADARDRGGSDLVLIDVQMPEAFGDDVALTLRMTYEIQAPIYLLSGLDEKDLAERVQWAQIEGFISKKVGIDGIVSRVQQILSVD
jgi:two-component system alkaline phosphatase synthesis response regulator PhoP